MFMMNGCHSHVVDKGDGTEEGVHSGGVPVQLDTGRSFSSTISGGCLARTLNGLPYAFLFIALGRV